MCGYCHHSTPYAMHYGYCRITGTVICVGTAIALYYCSPCTVITAMYVGTAIALYCMLLYAMHYGYCHMRGCCHRFILWAMHRGIATTCVGIVIGYTILTYHTVNDESLA